MSTSKITELAKLLPDKEYDLNGQTLNAEGLMAQVAIALYMALNKKGTSLLDEVEKLEPLLVTVPAGYELAFLTMIRQALDAGTILIDEINGVLNVVESVAGADDSVSLLGQKVIEMKKERGRKKSRQKQKIRNQRHKEGVLPGRIKISKVSDMELIIHHHEVKQIHLADQEVLTKASIMRMIELFPSLTLITAPRSLFDKFLWLGSDAESILSREGIKYEKGYWRNEEIYSKTRMTSELEDKTELYKEVFVYKTKEKIRIMLEDMDEFGILELDLLHLYLAGKPTSLTKIAGKLGLGPGYVNFVVSTSLFIMGEKSGDRRVIEAAKSKVLKYEKYKKTKKNRKNWEKMRQDHGVRVAIDGLSLPVGRMLYPPDNLPFKQWSKWHQLMLLYSVKNRSAWDELERDKPHYTHALERYFQLGVFHGTETTLQAVGRMVRGPSGEFVVAEGVRQWMNLGFEILGIKDE